MSSRPMSWPEARKVPPVLGVSPRFAMLAQSLAQHVRDGLSPQLALDLVLNELVVAATAATRASAAALALTRGTDLVCRATTGDHAPDLGVPLNARDGLSGVCIRSGIPQHCDDTESDQRVDSAAVRRLGIRSILVVPIFEADGRSKPVGIMEVFSKHPAAFSASDESALQAFARDCIVLRQRSLELEQVPPAQFLELEPLLQSSSRLPDENDEPLFSLQDVAQDSIPRNRPPSLASDLSPMDVSLPTVSQRESRLDPWTIVLAVLVAAAALLLIFLIGLRTGAFRAIYGLLGGKPASVAASDSVASGTSGVASEAPIAPTHSPPQKTNDPASHTPGSLVVYDRGKVVFREYPEGTNDGKVVSSNPDSSGAPLIWLSPVGAEARLRDRVEPDYPADARASHRSGDVTLEIVVREDGTVASVRTVSGDSLLADAASAAVRRWRYEPFRIKGNPAQFQTDVTLKFSLPQ